MHDLNVQNQVLDLRANSHHVSLDERTDKTIVLAQNANPPNASDSFVPTQNSIQSLTHSPMSRVKPSTGKKRQQFSDEKVLILSNESFDYP